MDSPIPNWEMVDEQSHQEKYAGLYDRWERNHLFPPADDAAFIKRKKWFGPDQIMPVIISTNEPKRGACKKYYDSQRRSSSEEKHEGCGNAARCCQFVLPATYKTVQHIGINPHVKEHKNPGVQALTGGGLTKIRTGLTAQTEKAGKPVLWAINPSIVRARFSLGR